MQNLGRSLYNNDTDQNFDTTYNQYDNEDLSTYLGQDWNQTNNNDLLNYQQSRPISILDNAANYANEASQFYLNPHYMSQAQNSDHTSVSPESAHQALCGSISNAVSPSDSGVSDCSERRSRLIYFLPTNRRKRFALELLDESWYITDCKEDLKVPDRKISNMFNNS
uniref:Uncharacterized protein n=1 Tax=Romanomermis culicivorax TaxID=13658 RepID=A0A915KG29_ROMCU